MKPFTLVQGMNAARISADQPIFDTCLWKTVQAKPGDVLISCPGFAKVISCAEFKQNFTTLEGGTMTFDKGHPNLEVIPYYLKKGEVVDAHFVTDTRTGLVEKVLFNQTPLFVTRELPITVFTWIFQKA